eukprot:Nk52_evm27s217 gene=Nk52_evmTU27s217
MMAEVKSLFTGRLPAYVIPKLYRVHWDVNVDADVKRFHGKVDIEIELLQSTDELIIHCLDLDLHNVLIETSTRVFKSKEEILDKGNEIAYLRFADLILVSKSCILSMSFSGNFKSEGTGLSKFPFENAATGEKEHIIFTQFQPVLARCAFPCFDEPGLKAPFHLSLFTYSSSNADLREWTVLGNTQVKEESKMDSRTIEGHVYQGNFIQFEVSPPMSSYLLTFCVGKLTYVEDTLTSGDRTIQMRFYAPTGNEQKTKLPLQLSKKCIEFYTEFYGTAFPLAKLDSVANPGFPGGMENWGLIWYNDQNIYQLERAIKLKDRGISISFEKLIAHEIGHQWFGNLVTMKWWDDLWLNEAFTEWSAHKAIEHISPEFDLCSELYEKCTMDAFSSDSRVSSHPVQMKLKHSREISSAFDSVTYSKGCALIHMMAETIGQEVLREGLKCYFERYAYKATTTNDLWATLGGKSKEDIEAIMHSFTSVKGFPVVEVERKKNRIQATVA